jgi:5-hydroxyisourate hydrolase-like protein (transthyretin family)
MQRRFLHIGLVSLGLFAGLSRGSDEAPQKNSADATGPTFQGMVRFVGRPAPGVTVWLIGSSDQSWQPELAKTQADEQGRYTLPVKSGGRWVVARDAKGRLGWFEILLGSELTWEPALRLELHETGDARGKLFGPDGQPLRGHIRMYALSLPRDSNDATGPYRERSLSPPAPLAKELETTLAKDGSFIVRGIPVRSKVGAVITAPGYDGIRISWDQEQPLELRLEKPGEARFRFSGATDPTKLAGLTFRLYRQSRSEDQTVPALFFWRQVKAEAQNTLLLTNLYPGVYSLNPEPDAPVSWEAETPAPFTVQPGNASELTIAVKPKARIHGRIIDRVSGKGVPEVGINVFAPTDRGYSEFRAWVKTDANGRFSAYARPGKLSLSVSTPAGYLPPEEVKETATVGPATFFTFADIALQPAVPVDGVVQDSEGRPVQGVLVVTAHVPPPYGPPFGDAAIYSDAAGHFTVRNLGPRDFTALRARTAKAVTNGGVPLDVAKQKDPVKLVLSETDAFRLRGRVNNDAGQPVADAAVEIHWRYRGVGRASRMGWGARLGTYRTDADGRFETRALWPGDDYSVRVMAADHGPGQSRQVTGQAGQVADLGTISLPRTAGRVAGAVVDGAGQPVVGAKVFNEGDAPGPVQTTTDAAGRFKIEGLFDGPVYLFAHKPGYRFSMARTRSGDTAVSIRMLKAGDAVPAGEQPNPRPPDYAAAEQNLTRHLLERLWALPRHVTSGYENRVLEGMAAVDLAQAKKWLTEEAKRRPGTLDERMSRAIRVAEAEKAADDDPDEALALLSPLQAEHAFEVLLRLAERYAKPDTSKAARFAEEAVVKARARNLPERAWSLAQAGDLVIRLGQPAAGRKLLTEAADLAEQFGTERMQGFVREKVAELLAPVDLARSRSLLKGFTDPENDKYRLARIAIRLAPTDLPQALAILAGIQPGNTFVRDESRLQIAYLLAEKEPAEAIKQAEAIAEPRYRTTAFSGVAALIGRRDPGLARSLIDRALELYLDRPHEFNGWGSMGRSTLAAWTAYHARLAGYPDMASVVARVLACRPTNPPFDVSHILLHTAIPLSLTDPVTARQLVQQALPDDHPPKDKRHRSRKALFAVALADPERGIRLVDEVIDDALKSSDGLRGTSLVELVMTLTAPSEQLRVRQLNTWIDHSWTPGTEDYP